jgi:hypothetical protein
VEIPQPVVKEKLMPIDFDNLTPEQLRKMILKQEEDQRKSPSDNLDDIGQAISEAELKEALSNSTTPPAYTPPPAGNKSVDWSAAGGGTQKFNFADIKDLYKQLETGEGAQGAIAGAGKFLYEKLAGINENNRAAYQACGVQTDRAWCMNFVNAALHMRGLKPSGSDAAISALSLGSKIPFSEAKPGDIILQADGHHAGIMMGRTKDGRAVMLSGNFNDTVAYSTVGADYGVVIRHSGELDPNRPEAMVAKASETSRISDLKNFGTPPSTATNTAAAKPAAPTATLTVSG